MKTEHILARVNDALAPLNAARPDADATRAALQLLASDLAEQVRMESAASKGAGNAAKTIQAILTKLRKKDHRTALHYAWVDAKGRQCVCDGFRAFRLTEHLPMEDRPADAGDPIDLDKVVPAITQDTHYALPLPSIAELKAHIAIERAAKRSPLWDFGDAAPTVNAEYLRDLLTVLPDAAEIYVQRGRTGIASVMLAKGERGEAILLPVRCKRYADKAAAAAEAEAEYQAANAAALAEEKRRSQLDFLLSCYRDELDHDPGYSLTPDQFAELAKYAQPAA